MDDTKLLIDGCNGVYVPKRFYENFDLSAWHVDDIDGIEALGDIESRHYDDVWQEVLETAYFMQDGVKWTLTQDGDLFAIANI